jgi:hypothetical protein
VVEKLDSLDRLLWRIQGVSALSSASSSRQNAVPTFILVKEGEGQQLSCLCSVHPAAEFQVGVTKQSYHSINQMCCVVLSKTFG